jgi:hypothetical protein
MTVEAVFVVLKEVQTAHSVGTEGQLVGSFAQIVGMDLDYWEMEEEEVAD